MGPQDEPATFDPKPGSEGRKKGAANPEPSAANLVSFTIDAETGRLVKIEALDPGGQRQELSDEARANLGRKAKATVEAIVEEAFEAGIDCVLGASGETEAPESDEDADLRRLLLRSLIQHSAAKRLVQREVLDRAIVGSLIANAGAREAKAEAAATH